MDRKKRTHDSHSTLIKGSILFLIFSILVYLGYFGYEKYQEYRIAKIRMEMQKNILDGATAKPIVVKVDYSHQTGETSALLFGGAHTPLLEHKDAWNLINDAGVTMIRRDFFIEQILPSNISLWDYKNNVNGVQDPSKWKQDAISWEADRFKTARSYGMKTMGIMAYIPAWLSSTGTPYGVPKDWDVYEDIVAKMYAIYKDDVDYLEIWNEATFDHFLNTPRQNRHMLKFSAMP